MCCQDASGDNRRLVRVENYDDSVELFTPWNSFFFLPCLKPSPAQSERSFFLQQPVRLMNDDNLLHVNKD